MPYVKVVPRIKPSLGLSLIELLVVMALIGIGCQFAYQSWSTTRCRHQQMATIRKLYHLMQSARIQALQHQQPVKVCLVPGPSSSPQAAPHIDNRLEIDHLPQSDTRLQIDNHPSWFCEIYHWQDGWQLARQFPLPLAAPLTLDSGHIHAWYWQANGMVSPRASIYVYPPNQSTTASPGLVIYDSGRIRLVNVS